ncbi:MAG: hypothetical protein M1817_001958 [Caeruleum heppii]|nr:MAG: hypothetical protein M1817_001958 [Caeruleum heppii]
MLRSRSSPSAPPSPRRPKTMEYLQRRASSLLLRTPASAPITHKTRLSSSSSSSRHNNTSVPAKDLARDPTPSSPAELEGLLNYHLSQSSTLSSRIVWLNEQIDRDIIVLLRVQQEEGRRREVKCLEERIQVLWDCKKGLGRPMIWHQEESVRIKVLLLERGSKSQDCVDQDMLSLAEACKELLSR